MSTTRSPYDEIAHVPTFTVTSTGRIAAINLIADPDVLPGLDVVLLSGQ